MAPLWPALRTLRLRQRLLWRPGAPPAADAALPLHTSEDNSRRHLAILVDIASSFLLALSTYISVECVFLSYDALEFLLDNLSKDIARATPLDHGDTFFYAVLCFFPLALKETSLKTILMPLFIAPTYVLLSGVVPVLHLYISFMSCSRSLDECEDHSSPPDTARKRLLRGICVELAAFSCVRAIHSASVSHRGPADAWAAVAGVVLAPATVLGRYVVEPADAEAASADPCADAPLPKAGAMLALCGLVAGGLLARAAELYVECLLAFGVGPLVWRHLYFLARAWQLPHAVAALAALVSCWAFILPSLHAIRLLFCAAIDAHTREGDMLVVV